MNTFQQVNHNNKFNKLSSEEKLAVAWWIDAGLIKRNVGFKELMKEAEMFYSRVESVLVDFPQGLLEEFKSDVNVYRDYKAKVLLES